MEIIEIRNYQLKEGKRDEFHRILENGSIPMLHRWKVKVVAFGKSLHDENSYYLIRKYDSLHQREESQNAFYNSEEWITNFDQPLMALIENYTTSVLDFSKFEISLATK